MMIALDQKESILDLNQMIDFYHAIPLTNQYERNSDDDEPMVWFNIY
jgi:hypothetical protein